MAEIFDEQQFLDYYHEEITSATYQQLKATLSWFNSKLGYHPFIIGGWAVWAYTRGLGSRDVDMVLPVKQSVEPVLIPYYQAHGFEKAGGLFAKYYVKKLKVRGRIEEFMLDVCTYADRNYFHTERKEGIELAWHHLENHHRPWDFEGGQAYIPTRELLLLMKIKAYRDRSYVLLQRGLHAIDAAYIRSKIWKDAHDIRGLVATVIDTDAFDQLIEETGLSVLKRKLEDVLHEVTAETS